MLEAQAAWSRGYREAMDKREKVSFGNIVSMDKSRGLGVWQRNLYIGKDVLACIELDQELGEWSFWLLGQEGDRHFCGTAGDAFVLAAMIRACEAERDERKNVAIRLARADREAQERIEEERGGLTSF